MTDAPKPKRQAAGAFAKDSPHYKPPVKYGSKGVGKGAGWGGEAKGDGSSWPASNLIPGFSDPARATNPEKTAKSAAAAEASAELTQRMRRVIVEIADDEAQPGNVRLTAAVAMLNRDEGMPVARTVGVLDANVKGISVQFVQPLETPDEDDAV